MKKILLFSIFLASISCGTTHYSASTLQVERIHDNLNKTKDELFVLSRDWAVNEFVKSNAVIEYSDKEEGIFIGKFILIHNVTQNLDLSTYCKLKIEVKDNKAKIFLIPMQDFWAGKTGLENMRKLMSDVLISYENYIKSEKKNW